jgi:long-subunit acyl-CoA synthetase (AMP-forming)
LALITRRLSLIVDRKKELIINSAGKNIAPAMVENRVQQRSPLIGHVAAIGDRRSDLTALIALDEEVLQEFASRNGLRGSFGELAGDETMHAEVDRAVTEANSTLARVEQIKKFTIVDCSWLPGSEEVTPGR